MQSPADHGALLGADGVLELLVPENLAELLEQDVEFLGVPAELGRGGQVAVLATLACHEGDLCGGDTCQFRYLGGYGGCQILPPRE